MCVILASGGDLLTSNVVLFCIQQVFTLDDLGVRLGNQQVSQEADERASNDFSIWIRIFQSLIQ